MRGVAEVKEPCSLPMLSVDMENKENGSVGVKNVFLVGERRGFVLRDLQSKARLCDWMYTPGKSSWMRYGESQTNTPNAEMRQSPSNCSSMENGRPPDPADWAVMDVVNYFRTVGFEEQANAFQEQTWTELYHQLSCFPSMQEIDGKSLLLMTRNDVLTGLQLKLGPALKIYEYHVKPLQTKHLKNNSS
ncbi:sterile alpha motif domain-containing protein 13 isoform X1 [Pongo pygmaeus]|uniref:sterile alpha motif domain-containing protein 13 isoform X1 n=1 Tax=Pongo pygmaeus TaxID=9600 RepID=UPI00300D0919